MGIAVMVFSQLISGCYVFSYKGEKPFREEYINKIHSGETSKQEILLWFGPPVAVVGKDMVMKTSPTISEKECPYEVRPENFFKLFSCTNERSECYRIYYYHYCKTVTDFVFCWYGDEAKKTFFVDKLWVLINTETGVVKDFIFEKQK
jgi:hypothetical protein